MVFFRTYKQLTKKHTKRRMYIKIFVYLCNEVFIVGKHNNKIINNIMSVRFYTSGEEFVNSVTHFVGMLLAPVMLILLIAVMSDNDIFVFSEGDVDLFSSISTKLLGAIMFCAGVFILYTSSTIYHWVQPGHLKSIFRYIDHISIYVLIAASYTPILICAIGGILGWVMFFIMWTFVVLGAIYKIFFLTKWPRLSLALYLTMGWSCIFIAVPVWQKLPASALSCIFAEGFFYTAGSYFFVHDNRKYFHALWHVFVLLGTISHFAAVWIIMA